MPLSISIIVPVVNEAKVLPCLLRDARDWRVSEVVIVDGGSSDETLSLIRNAPYVKAITSPKGRCHQMNAGAAAATGDLLLFLHADSILPIPSSLWINEITTALTDPHVVGGTFRLAIRPSSLFLKWISMIANLRSLFLGLPYGDQGIFVRSNVFKQMGGYRDIPLMEDVEFIQRLKQEGKIVLLKQVIATSARRWERGGAMVSLRNILLLILYFLGVCPTRLARWYH